MARTPTPGRPVRGSTTGRPVMALFDLVGRRWALRVIWELHEADSPPSFRELRSACAEMSSSVLTTRLAELGEAGIVASTEEGYALTQQGASLVAALLPLTHWAESWTPDGPR